jgi:hypothetical protein
VEEFARIKSGDVVLATHTADGRPGKTVRLRCVTAPDEGQKVLLSRVGLTLPQRLRRVAEVAKCSEDFSQGNFPNKREVVSDGNAPIFDLLTIRLRHVTDDGLAQLFHELQAENLNPDHLLFLVKVDKDIRVIRVSYGNRRLNLRFGKTDVQGANAISLRVHRSVEFHIPPIGLTTPLPRQFPGLWRLAGK